MEEVHKLLAGATPEEISSLSEILSCEANPESIVSTMQMGSMHGLHKTFGATPPTYNEILRKIGKHVGLKRKIQGNKELERCIAQKVWSDAWSRFTPQQRKEFDRKLQDYAATNHSSKLTGVALTGAGMLGAQLGGFATYMMASTAVGVLTGAMGITLPFAAYMGMSSIIGTVIGPPGWIALGLVTLWKLGKPDLAKITAAVCTICMIRARQEPDPLPEKFWNLGNMILFGMVILLLFLLAYFGIASHYSPNLNHLRSQ